MKAKTKPQKGSLVFAPHAETTTVIQSAVDSLFSKKEDNPWPSFVLTDSHVCEEITARERLVSLFELLFRNIPQQGDLFQVYTKELVDEESIIQFYESLAKLIAKPEIQRIILYLPFKCLPGETWRTQNPRLGEAWCDFVGSYRTAWKNVVMEWDFRGDFTDGEIPTYGEYPVNKSLLVCKAAHLLPVLVQKGIVLKEEVLSLVENSDDTVLKKSIQDVIPTMYEMGLLTKDEALKIRPDSSYYKTLSVKLEKEFTKRETWLEELATKIECSLGETLDELLLLEKTMRPERFAWEKSEKRKKVLEQYGHELAELLKTESDTVIQGESLLGVNNQNILLVIIFAIRELVETTHRVSAKQALQIKTLWKPTLLSIFHIGGRETQEAIESTWSRWNFLQLVPLCEKRKLPFAVQTGEQTFEMICETKQAQEAKAIAERLQSNTELLRFVYPTVLMCGSLVKGYGDKTADLDLAVFVRPETPIEKRDHIQQLFRETISSKFMKSPPIEFWLSEDGDNLTVCDFESIDAFLGDSSLIHVLWKGIWFGDKEVIETFHEKLLTSYLRVPQKEKLTKELERGLVQYRLMHKGYDRLYPKGPSFETQYGQDIGIESRFWDSGYRRLATKIFIRNVFVPSFDR